MAGNNPFVKRGRVRVHCTLYAVRGCKVITRETQSGARKGTHVPFLSRPMQVSGARDAAPGPIKSGRERESESIDKVREQLKETVEKRHGKRINSRISHELI